MANLYFHMCVWTVTYMSNSMHILQMHMHTDKHIIFSTVGQTDSVNIFQELLHTVILKYISRFYFNSWM